MLHYGKRILTSVTKRSDVSYRSCYLITTPPMFRVYAVIGREMPPYKTMIEDAALMLRLLTAGQMCFYTLLFSVKMSLMTLYRKLLAGLPSIYSKIWWGIVAFCVFVSSAESLHHASC